MDQYIQQQWPLLLDSVREAARDIFQRAQSGRQLTERKSDGSLLTATDIALQESIARILSNHFPEILVLGEEMAEEVQAAILATGDCWLLDPLDGTSNFSHGIPVYTVSLALMQQGEVVAGMVYDPNRDECFHALKGQGAYLDQQALDRRHDEPCELRHAMAMIDTKRLPNDLAIAIATQHPYHSQRSFGSVALDWCWLASGRIQTYLHGKQKLWDFAAGALVAQEAGCLTSTMQDAHILGTPLTLAARSAVGACPSLAATWPEWIRIHG
ncbi:MAG: inositol monophosphatase family protein [Nitrosomonadales bacterium]|nr:inositol monophosphatase family protein [Nitrosomonadales bacterium]